MASNSSAQNHTEDQLKQVEFLHATYQQLDDDQSAQHTELLTKITFLFGFVAAILTLYGTYATHVNDDFRFGAVILMGSALLLLCGAFRNRKYSRPPLPKLDIANSTYFDKLYKDTAYLERVYIKNKKPLIAIRAWLRWSIRAFVLGMICMSLSFIVPLQFVINYHQNEQHEPTKPSTTSR